MRVRDVDVIETARGTEIRAAVVWEDPRRHRDNVYFLYRDMGADAVATPGDALLAATLVPAIVVGEDVTVDAPVSSRLLHATGAIADFFVSWVPTWHRSRVEAEPADRSTLQPSLVGSSFSGGVDSFYTALRHRDEPITALVSIVGMDWDEHLPNLGPWTDQLARASAALGKRHVIIESNAFAVGKMHVRWSPSRGNVHQGAAVIACALGLGGLLREFDIAASFDSADLIPWGTHPALDPLWSTESTEVCHDGMDERYKKVETIASSQVALDTLHVCSRLRRDMANCGRCDKCVATSLLLLRAGALDRCRTLPGLQARVVRRTVIRPVWRGTFELIRDGIDDDELRRAINAALRRNALRQTLRPVVRCCTERESLSLVQSDPDRPATAAILISSRPGQRGSVPLST